MRLYTYARLLYTHIHTHTHTYIHRLSSAKKRSSERGRREDSMKRARFWSARYTYYTPRAHTTLGNSYDWRTAYTNCASLYLSSRLSPSLCELSLPISLRCAGRLSFVFSFRFFFHSFLSAFLFFTFLSAPAFSALCCSVFTSFSRIHFVSFTHSCARASAKRFMFCLFPGRASVLWVIIRRGVNWTFKEVGCEAFYFHVLINIVHCFIDDK